jgi:hypothetical protein
VSEHENELRAAFADIPERDAADWASSNLAVVIHRAGAVGWATAAEQHRQRATVMLAVRLFRAIRAAMAVLGAGYEVEARAMVRLVLETRARLLEVAGDQSHETGRRWLNGKPKTNISAAVRASAPELDAAAAQRLYGGLSQDAHADVGGIMRSLATVDEDLRAEITWGPRRTVDTHLSLLLCATFAAEAATLLALEAEVEHPHREALSRYLEQTESALRAAEVGSLDGR